MVLLVLSIGYFQFHVLYRHGGGVFQTNPELALPVANDFGFEVVGRVFGQVQTEQGTVSLFAGFRFRISSIGAVRLGLIALAIVQCQVAKGKVALGGGEAF